MILGDWKLGRGNDAAVATQRLQLGHDPVPPEGELGIIGRGRVRVDHHQRVSGGGFFHDLGLGEQYFSSRNNPSSRLLASVSRLRPYLALKRDGWRNLALARPEE